jgi:mono/diheme cytochrome c family protein
MTALALSLARPAAADPQVDYMLHCQGCHGPAGAGVAGQVPSFRGEVAKFVTVEGGREYLLRVPGTSQSELDDARTAELINWLLREFDEAHVPANFIAFTEAEVAAVRRPAYSDVALIRSRLRRLIAAREGEQPRE